MNRIIPVLLASSLTLSLFGNGGQLLSTRIAGGTTIKATTAPQGITVNKITFQTVTNTSTLPKAMLEKIEAVKKSRGFYLFENKEYGVKEDGYHLLIALGERPTAGYGIKVKAVEDNEGKTLVYVEEAKPAEGTMAAQVITYPYVVIKIKGVTPNVTIVEEKGKAYPNLKVEDKGIKVDKAEMAQLFKTIAILQSKLKAVTGTYSGKIDNNTIEVKVNGKPVSLVASSIILGDKALDGITAGDEVELLYFINGNKQNVLLYINETKPSTPAKQVVITAKGVYQGQVDGSSIEVKVNDQLLVLRLEGEMLKTFNSKMFAKGTHVEFSYYKNSYGQLILQHIEKVN